MRLEERLEASLTLLGEAAETFRSAAARDSSASLTANKSFASALAELDEARKVLSEIPKRPDYGMGGFKK